MNGQQAAARLRKLAEEVQTEIVGLEQLASTATENAAANERDLQATAQELAAVYLPRLEPQALADAEKRTGFQGFSRRNPLQAMAREQARLTTTLAQIVGDPRYQRREYLVGSQGELRLKLQEAKDLLETWDREAQRFERLEGFQLLVDLKYDTPAFEERWWQADYWRHWSLGDQICAALGLTDFGDDVLPAYHKARVPRDQWRGEVQRLSAEVREVLDLVRQKDEAEARLSRLSELYLEECQKLLATHLLTADVGLLDQWRGEDRAVEILLRRLSGLGARRDYFRDLATGELQRAIADLRFQRQKLVDKATKYLRPKYAHVAVADPAPNLAPKLSALRARREKALRQGERVQQFRDWDRYAIPGQTQQWWVVWVDSPPPIWVEDWRTGASLGGPTRDDGWEPPAQEVADFSPHGDLS